MSAYAYCRDKVALPGSSLYYSLLFVRPALREALTALHAAAEAFRHVAEQVSDADVARTKLAWWAEEMQRAASGAPRHPITRVLAQPMREAGVDSTRFIGVLNAFVVHSERRMHQAQRIQVARLLDDRQHCSRCFLVAKSDQ